MSKRIIARIPALALLCGAVLTLDAASAQRSGDNKRLDELDEVVVKGDAALRGRAAIAAWFRRMAGTYRDSGTERWAGGPTFIVQGKSDCSIFGTGPGLQCVVIQSSTSPRETHLNPAMLLFGFDHDRSKILHMAVNDLGVGQSSVAELRGNTATFRLPCLSADGKSCRRTTTYTAKPDSDEVRMKSELEVGGDVIASWDIIKTRLPEADAAPRTADRDGPPADDVRIGSATDTDAVVSTSDGRAPGEYTEPLCEPLADMSDLAAAYTPARLRFTLEALARRRYPYGLVAIREQPDQLLMRWFPGNPTFRDVIERFNVAVHEGMHHWDSMSSGIDRHAYRVRDDLVIATRRLNNFPRSEILTIHPDAAKDDYARLYLDGNSGTQGFNNLLDEFNAYVHSIATSYCLRDQIPANRRISARDGVLTMMFYVEAYLKLARTQHASDYAAIIADANHVRLILTLWSRAEFYLTITSRMPQLGIRDATISGWVYNPYNVMEIDRLRDLRSKSTTR